MRNRVVPVLRFYGPSRRKRQCSLKEKVMDNLISTVWVIHSQDMGTEPIIYLRKPDLQLQGNETLIEFANPFAAKKAIQDEHDTNIFITVTKEKYSQLLAVSK